MEPQLPIAIRWHGRGGQGVVTASRILATAALKAGYFMQSLPDFGAERSGAPIAAHTRISETPPVERGPIERPDVVIILDASLIEQGNVADGLSTTGTVILNIRDDEQAKLQGLRLSSTQTLWTLDAGGIGVRLLGRNLPNTPALGAFARAAPVLPLETIASSLRDLMHESFSESVIKANLEALAEGYDAVRTVKEIVNA